jgi:glycosyltransferase involved in cell wall biosynthesis
VPALTFAIPAYNQPCEQLRAAIVSLIRQDRDDWTAVVLDDSPVPTAYEDVVRSFGDARLRYTRNTGAHGIGGAWNACVNAIDTEFYTIVHADDELAPSYASTMLRLANDHPDGTMYFCAAEIIDAAGRRTFSLADFVKDYIRPSGREVCIAGEAGLVRLAVGNFIVCPTVLYRRSRIGARRFSTELRFVVDLDFTTDALLAGERIYGTSAVGYRYRRHDAGTTQVLGRSGQRFDEEITFYRGLARRARAAGMQRAAHVARAMPLVRLNILASALGDALGGRWHGARAKATQLARSYGNG